MSNYEVHEFANLFPMMEKDDLQGLTESIRTSGMKEKITLYEGKILDGRNRSAACEQAGVPPIYEEFTGSKMEALNYVFIKNEHRRNLTSSQRAAIAVEKEEMVLAILQEIHQAKNTSIPQKEQKGGESSPPQIIAEQNQKNWERETTAQIAKIVGTNRQYIKDARKIKDSYPDRHDQIKRGIITISKVKKEINQEQRQQARQKMDETARKNLQSQPVNIQIYHGDCLELSKTLEDNSLDAILTDPPYPKEFLECWSKLSLIASQKLKPGGFCIAYTGKMFLPEVIRRMGEHLEYFWMISLLHKGPFNPTYPRSVENRYKPILIYIKPPIEDNLLNRRKEHFIDVLQGTGREKSDHEWQQAEDELKYLFDKFTLEGNTILDPFAGSGTVLAMAQKLNRHAIGFELDGKYIPGIKQRLGLEISPVIEDSDNATAG